MSTIERLILVAITLFFAAIIFYIADSSFLPKREASAVIEDKSHMPGYYQTTMSGKTPITTWIPPTWTVTADGKGCPVSSSTYDKARIGKEARVFLVSGRFTDHTYCKGLSL